MSKTAKTIQKFRKEQVLGLISTTKNMPTDAKWIALLGHIANWALSSNLNLNQLHLLWIRLDLKLLEISLKHFIYRETCSLLSRRSSWHRVHADDEWKRKELNPPSQLFLQPQMDAHFFLLWITHLSHRDKASSFLQTQLKSKISPPTPLDRLHRPQPLLPLSNGSYRAPGEACLQCSKRASIYLPVMICRSRAQNAAGIHWVDALVKEPGVDPAPQHCLCRASSSFQHALRYTDTLSHQL